METVEPKQSAGYQHMMIDYHVARLREIRRERTAKLKAIRNRRQAEKYQETVRHALAGAFRPRPPKTPLNARITGVLERGTYRIEKVVFESRPGCLVTANLYLPSGDGGKKPAVLFPCGHSGNGKAWTSYQQTCQRLARNGFVALIYDPICQGERDQYHHLPVGHPLHDCCYAHNMMGKQLELCGDWFGMWRAWDGIRALDYLLSRPEVDASRVGITGNSGGGTMTSWLWAVEERFVMAAPSCFVTSFMANLENEIPSDCEQYPPGVIGAGLEQADFFLVRAPRPVIILAEELDFFDPRGTREAYAEMRRFYGLFGAEDKVALHMGGGIHSYPPAAQQAMLGFFSRQIGKKYRSDEIPEAPETNADLFATPHGQVVPAGAKPVFKIIGEQAGRIISGRRAMPARRIRDTVGNLLHLSRETGIPHYRKLPAFSTGTRPDLGAVLRGKCPSLKEETIFVRYAVETEGDVRAILTKRWIGCQSVPLAEKTVNLYLPHFSSEHDLVTEPLVHHLLEQGITYLLDPRGLGQSAPEEYRDFFSPYGMDYLCHGYSLMLGESFLGDRVRDVLSVLNLLVAEGTRDIRLYGRGQGAILALLAGIFHPKVSLVVMKNGPLSCREWTQTPSVDWPAANFIRGLLAQGDLPDLIRLLGDRVQLIEPWDSGMKPYGKKELREAMQNAGLPAKLLRTQR